jgi:transcriptional antiterminator NusG
VAAPELVSSPPRSLRPLRADTDGDDPAEEFKAQLRRVPGDWYVIHSYAGYENR